MKWISKNKKLFLLLLLIVILIAGLLDVKYEGLCFQLFPHSIQSFLANIF